MQTLDGLEQLMQTNNGIFGYNQACMMTDSCLMQTQEHIQTNVNYILSNQCKQWNNWKKYEQILESLDINQACLMTESSS